MILDTNYVTLKLEDGILYAVYKSEYDIDYDIAKQMVKSRLEFTNGKTYPALVDIRDIGTLTKEARDYFSSKEAQSGVSAGAILTGSVFTRIIGNFFLQVNIKGRVIPNKLFTDQRKALEWLGQFK